MKKTYLFCLFVTVTVTSSLPLLQTASQGEYMGVVVLGDLDGDKIVSESELADNILLYLTATYLGESNEHLKLDKLREAAHIHRYYPRAIIDSAGRNVTIYKPLKRIVVFNSETVETMRSLNATDKIVGVGEYTIKDKIFFPEFTNYPNVGSVWSPNYEEVLNCNPDAVFLYATCSPSYCEAIQNKLNELDSDIIVVRLDCFKPASYTKEVEDLGYILEKEEEARTLVDFYEGVLNSIKEKVDAIPDEGRPEVYFEAYDRYKTAGRESGWHQKLIAAGANNIFSDLSGGYVYVDAEEVVKRNPEFIVSAPSYYAGGYDTDDITELSNPWKEIVSRPELAKVNAVKNGNVYVLSSDAFGGVRHFVAIAYMAKWFHPGLFEDLDPKAIHQEYLIRFQGLDYDLDKHGVFVYPPFGS